MKLQQIFFNPPKISVIDKNKYKKAKKELINNLKTNKFGFLSELNYPRINEINKIAKCLRKFEKVIFLGTGGSSLGGKTLISITENFYLSQLKPQIFFLENVDHISISQLIKKIKLRKTGIVIISKSGETIETISQSIFLLNEFKKKKISAKNNFFVITENKKSTLKYIQETYNFKYIQHSDIIGGRFSVFSVVGLIPAKLSGFDIIKFCKAGKNFLDKISLDQKKFDNLFLPSLHQYVLNNKGNKISVIMPYVDSLQNLTLWYRQLLAESCGKNSEGITPVNSSGTVDQHSQLQLYLDGPKDKFFTFISRKKIKSRKLDCTKISKKFNLLQSKSLEDLLRAEFLATSQTLVQKGLYVRKIELEKINESSTAELMAFFFVETILICYLLNVNPFDQPAVEDGKVLTKKFLNETKN